MIRGILCVLLSAIGFGLEAAPLPPCGAPGEAVEPEYAAPGAPPAIAVWHDIEIGPDSPCLAGMAGKMKVVIALAGKFRSDRSMDEMAGRIGAISKTEGMRYWSISDGDWRTMISEAFALESDDPDTRRADFTAPEMFGDRPLYFAQRDTRSSTLNVYRLTGRLITPERLSVTVVNRTTVRLVFIPLYGPGALRSLHIIERLAPGVWGYYALSTIAEGSVTGNAKSMINRAVAVYRFLRGVPGDRDPPLAR